MQPSISKLVFSQQNKKPKVVVIFAQMYKVARRLLFLFDAEKVHHFSMNMFRSVNRTFFGGLIKKTFHPSHNPVKVFGLHFRNRVGLGAGFDKNALYLAELDNIGFGFIEIGTVTPLPQDGNERPRLFRLPADKALVNRMGFNNDGAHVIAERLRNWRKHGSAMIVGGNIGKNKNTQNNDAWLDYEICFRTLYPYVDYFVVNVSSPNTPGLRELQEVGSLKRILTNLQENRAGEKVYRPILLKIAPDLTMEHFNEVIDLALNIDLDGLIISNTTLSREGLSSSSQEVENAGAGGLSGAPLTNRVTSLIKHAFARSNGKLNIIASGGVFSAEDARAHINAGAKLVQVWTGFIYEGPAIVKRITNGLA